MRLVLLVMLQAMFEEQVQLARLVIDGKSAQRETSIPVFLGCRVRQDNDVGAR